MPFVRSSSFATVRYEILERIDTVVRGVPRSDWRYVGKVHVTPLLFDQQRDATMATYEYPVTNIVRADPHEGIVPGNRMRYGEHTFDILGIDDTPTQWLVHLRELPR